MKLTVNTSQYLAEFLGTAGLLLVVTGSGIMGAALSPDNMAVALLANSIATGCGLYVLIHLCGPYSGAHFNPAVSLLAWRNGTFGTKTLCGYMVLQMLGAIAGVWLAHYVFEIPILQSSLHERHGAGVWVSELVSTLILLSVITIGLKHHKEKTPLLVAFTVTAGYWFTSSTFFANPAVTLARSLTDTFVGIAPADVLGFVMAQLLAVGLFILLSQKSFTGK